MGITILDGQLLSRMIISGANELTQNKQLVDAMNVFPVPDGDTGTNMSLTVLAAAKEAEKNAALKTEIHIDEIAKVAASGALRGARGNSGVITSQLFRGFSKGLEGLAAAGVKELAAAVEQGVKTAYKAVMKPKEGTILTVARGCAEAAVRLAEETEDIKEFLKGILEEGHRMLEKTPDMLPVLKQAGVVDAGGRGLLYVLEGALKQLEGDMPVYVAEPQKAEAETPDFASLASVENTSITFGYCTEFFVNVDHPEERTVNQLKAYLGSIGDSIVCVSDEDIIKIHVHTDHPGLAIEKALEIGSLSGLKIDNMREQHTNKINFSASEKPAAVPEEKAETPAERKEIGFVSISTGDGLTAIFKNLGVDEVIEGGQTMNPSTEDILNAVEKVNADNVFILPNNKNIILAAEQAAALSEDKKLFVIPTKSVPEGISAVFCCEEGAAPEELEKAMNEAVQSVDTAQVTFAVRDTSLGDKEIHEGNILGMLNDKIEVVAEDVAEGTKELLQKAVKADSEIISIYYGEDVTEADAEEIAAFAETLCPDCDIEVQNGGQPLYYYIISVE